MPIKIFLARRNCHSVKSKTFLTRRNCHSVKNRTFDGIEKFFPQRLELSRPVGTVNPSGLQFSLLGKGSNQRRKHFSDSRESSKTQLLLGFENKIVRNICGLNIYCNFASVIRRELKMRIGNLHHHHHYSNNGQ